MKQLRIAGQAPPVTQMAAPAWLGYGFRPFFLLSALAGFLLIASWLPIYTNHETYHLAFIPINWHAHEMLFGFVGAAIAGFLLTAVPNWTGIPTPRGWTLGGLALLWLAGRAVCGLAGPDPSWFFIGIDLAFLPGLAIALAYPLIKARQLRNLVFLPLIVALTVANALFWAKRPEGISLAIYSILIIIVLIGGRVIPFFTERGLPGSKPVRYPWIERLAPWSMVVVAVVEVARLPLTYTAYVLGFAALVQAIRLWGWFDRNLWRVPLLWILHIAYACMPVGLALKALGVGGTAPLHFLTAGCMGCMILGMMARVALGHTGRELKPARPIVLAFVLMIMAAMTRTLVPIIYPAGTTHALWCTAVLWCTALFLYTVVYFPILTRPRIDGQPG